MGICFQFSCLLSKIDGSYGNSKFYILRNCQTPLHCGCTVFSFLPAHKSFPIFHIFTNTYCPSFLLLPSYWVGSGISLWFCFSLKTNDVGSISHVYGPFDASSFETCLFKSFPAPPTHFKNQIFFLLLQEIFVYILDTRP